MRLNLTCVRESVSRVADAAVLHFHPKLVLPMIETPALLESWTSNDASPVTLREFVSLYELNLVFVFGSKVRTGSIGLPTTFDWSSNESASWICRLPDIRQVAPRATKTPPCCRDVSVGRKRTVGVVAAPGREDGGSRWIGCWGCLTVTSFSLGHADVALEAETNKTFPWNSFCFSFEKGSITTCKPMMTC